MKLALIIALVTCSILTNAYAQNTGDTILVQSLTYSSTTRDTVVEFPNDPTLSFEKIIMRYAMRCHDGLVTNGSAQGCGGWDYSCNTYIHDSTKADSVKQLINEYLFFPDTVGTYEFSNTPTYQTQDITQQEVIVNTIIDEDTASIGTSSSQSPDFISSNKQGGKSLFIINSTELIAAGLLVGDIDGILLNNLGSSAQIENLSISIKHTSINEFSTVSESDYNTGYTEVYFSDYDFSPGMNRVQFHSPFSWDGTSNIMVRITNIGNDLSSTIQLASSSESINTSAFTHKDLSYEFIPGSYIEANSYLGVAGNASRTIEAWVKTTTNGKEIVSWGTNGTSAKMAFRTNGSGRLRLEISGGGIEGSTIITDGNWHHVALVFNGTKLSQTKFYVDGNLETISANSTIDLTTILNEKLTVSKGFHNRYWDGLIDDIRVWETNVSIGTIQEWMYTKINSTHPNFSQLGLNYIGDSESQMVDDQGPSANDGLFNYLPNWEKIYGEEHFKEFSITNLRPIVHFLQGDYDLNISPINKVDTTHYDPIDIIENSIVSHTGTLQSDEVMTNHMEVYPKHNMHLDINGNVVSLTTSSSPISYANSTLEYFLRNPMKMEIMSFVTPYGNNLDLGINGKAWYFDVTDLTNTLKGDRRLTMERGGEWQEEMDIQFLFVVGTPPQNVLDNQQIWPVTSASYTNIMSNEAFEPHTIQLNPNASRFAIKSAITGHGQQGEFIPRTHYIDANGTRFSRQVWKECAQNPVYPQGGTWIYDRAGWCPGMPTDIAYYDITNLIDASHELEVDYGINTASGTSNYIVNNQLVSYGPINHNIDAKVSTVISPNSDIEFGRMNPVCDYPVITIQNTGATPMTTASIEYWVNDNPQHETFHWEGDLEFLESEDVTLPFTENTFWYNLQNLGNKFKVKITNVNGTNDEYSYNDQLESKFNMPDIISSNFYIQFKTNNAASESSYDITDMDGNILFQRSNLTNNTTYKDTFNLTLDCYALNLYDSDDDGINFWANSDGSGYFQIREVGGGILKTINPDFGGDYRYQFTTDTPLTDEEIELNQSLDVYPNPTNDIINIEMNGIKNQEWMLFDSMGRQLQNGMTSSNNQYTHKIDLKPYDSGVYFLKINNNEQSFIKQIIKN